MPDRNEAKAETGRDATSAAIKLLTEIGPS
jgi:hypothetical protein